MIKNIFFFMIAFGSVIFSQEENNYLSGSLKNDSHFVLSEFANLQIDDNIDILSKRKTPIIAGLMSFAIPGAGEIYTENYLKAGIFAAIEVGAIVIAVINNGKGDDQTEKFESFAHEHWSAARYAKWTFNNVDKLNPNLLEDVVRMDYYNKNLFNEEVVNYDVLNELENEVTSFPAGQYYSHRLERFGHQQYYEMIGKYSQFNVGWDEFGNDANKEYNYGDPLVDQFHFYSKERGIANDFYNVSKWAVIAVVTNHFVSAIDAAWSASKYNKKLKLNVSIQRENIGFVTEYFPQLNLKLNL
ncbi:MAG: hypothetical protein V3V16_08030 [Melioribacteraceae bacterium]